MEGILPLWKPKGMTSHDCVFQIRRLLKTKKVGHTGTLDPDVTGVLPICLGRATKIAEYMTNAGKKYEGEVVIGTGTTTEDASGDIISSVPVNDFIPLEDIQGVLKDLTGEIEQTPPMFSAVKVQGKRLYEYAREGIEVERPTRKVHIYEITLLADTIRLIDKQLAFRFTVHCSKGTYVRTLAVMIGERLGYPAHMSQLIRTESASFTKNECVTFEDLIERVNEDTVSEIIYPLERGISHLPSLEVSDKLALKVKNGAVLEKPASWKDKETAITHNKRAIAIYHTHPAKADLIKPVKVLRTN